MRVGKSMKHFVGFISDKRTVCSQRQDGGVLCDGLVYVFNEA